LPRRLGNSPPISAGSPDWSLPRVLDCMCANAKVSEPVDARPRSGRHDRSAVVLRNDRRPGECLPGGQVGAPVEIDRLARAVQPYVGPTGRARGSLDFADPADVGIWGRIAGDEAKVHQLDLA